MKHFCSTLSRTKCWCISGCLYIFTFFNRASVFSIQLFGTYETQRWGRLRTFKLFFTYVSLS